MPARQSPDGAGSTCPAEPFPAAEPRTAGDPAAGTGDSVPTTSDPTTSDPTTSDPGNVTVDWDGLPDAIRMRLADLAAAAVGDLPSAELPAAVRPVARFAVTRRARLGASALLASLRDSVTFRLAVTRWGRRQRPEFFDPDVADPPTAAAAAVLLDLAEAPDRVAEIALRGSNAQLRAERDAALSKIDRLRAENRRLRAELEAATEAAQCAGMAGTAEADRLRGRLREQGVRLRAALDRAEQAQAQHAADIARLQQALAEVEAQRDRERERADLANQRAERVSAEADAARQAVREARAADEVRLRLLLDTVAGAVGGLRRELALSEDGRAAGPRPGDSVPGSGPLNGMAGVVQDAAVLDRLLTLPELHLVVDGYNVTKTGYPDLTLSDQRTRLIQQLSALAARIGAEVTVVFDGAGVVAGPPTASRAVRVLFSKPGVLADDVITSLVTAEPQGRPVIVVTSDRAVVEAVRRQGAYPVPSALLLSRLPGS